MSSKIAWCQIDPLDDFINDVINEQKSSNFNYWNGTNQQPSGGVIVRFRYDVTGDGKEDYFYRSTISPSGKWTFYRSSSKGYIKSKNTVNMLDQVGARIREEEDFFVLTSVHEKLTWMSIVENKIYPDGKIETTEPQVIDGYENIQKEKKKAGWAEGVYGKLIVFENAEISSLQDVVLKKNPIWIKYDHRNFFYNQHKPSGKLRKEMFGVDFDSNMALETLNRAVSNKRKRSIREKEGNSHFSRMNRKSNPENKDIQKQNNNPSKRIYIAIVVILTGCGLLYLRRKFC